ncbi:MAG: RNA polymerase factor sigma-32 [Alphaproteobacteria bacterium]
MQEFSTRALHSAKRYPHLSRQQEYMFAKKWIEHKDAKAVEKILMSHQKLVIQIASGYRGYGLSIHDLVSEGNIGMLQAIRHYDPNKGFRFSTYALWWIKATMREYIIKTWSLVKIGTTRVQKKLFFGVRKTQRELFPEENPYVLTDEQAKTIAKKLNVSALEVLKMYHRLEVKDQSLNVPISSDNKNKGEWIEFLKDEQSSPEKISTEQNEIMRHRELLKKALDCLNKNEIHVITMRHLIDSPLTLKEIAEEMKLSSERVRQLQNKAFEKLKKRIRNLLKSH